MQLGTYLKKLRHSAGLSQEAVGAQGFVSTAGYIKVENGQRTPSSKLIVSLAVFFDRETHKQKMTESARAAQVKVLSLNMHVLKLLGDKSPLVQQIAREFAQDRLANAAELLSSAEGEKRGNRK